jgi:assimilatory nitrate reductase catalytic subunit
LPGGRDIENPDHRNFIANFWRIAESELPHTGLTACEVFDAIEKGEIKGLLSISFNPLVSIPDANRTRAALEKLEFYGCIDFFLTESARHADVVLAGSLQEEDEGTVTTGEGRCVRLHKSVTPPGNARVDWEIIVALAERLGFAEFFPYRLSDDMFRELARASAGAIVDYSGMNYSKIEKNMGIFWPCPSFKHPGTPRLFEDQRFYHEDGKARFYSFEYRPPAEDVDSEYPIFFTSGRVVSQYLSGSQTRRIGSLVDQYPEPKCEMHPQLASRLGVKEGDSVRVRTRRGEICVPAFIVKTIRPDTVFVPYHWPGNKSANLLTNRALDPISKIPEYKVCACRVEKV